MISFFYKRLTLMSVGSGLVMLSMLSLLGLLAKIKV